MLSYEEEDTCMSYEEEDTCCHMRCHTCRIRALILSSNSPRTFSCCRCCAPSSFCSSAMRALAGSWLARKIKKKQGKITKNNSAMRALAGSWLAMKNKIKRQGKKQFCYAGVGWLLVGKEQHISNTFVSTLAH